MNISALRSQQIDMLIRGFFNNTYFFASFEKSKKDAQPACYLSRRLQSSLRNPDS
jgi:hypothetical protein